MTRAAARAMFLPAALGLGTLLAFLAAAEAAIRFGLVNRFIVPMPSQVGGAFWRVMVEEDLPGRFLFTMGEGLVAGSMLAVVGIALGALMHRVRLLRAACETWVAALASAPVVLMYPLFLVIFGRSAWTIIMIGFVAGLPAVILKTIEGFSATRQVLLNVGRSFNLTPRQQFFKILVPSALPTIFVGLRLGLIFALINIVGVEFLINFGGLGQLINDLSERYDLPATYVAIAAVILVSVVFFDATGRVEKWLTRTQ